MNIYTKYQYFNLITIDEFKAKFKKEAKVYEKHIGGFSIKWKDKKWTLGNDFFNFLGKRIKLRPLKTANFTHVSIEGRLYHESWFKKDEFIKEDEFMI